MFRTWIIRQCNTVWVCKLTDIVTSLWLEIIKLDKEWLNVILLYGNILETNIWNKWGYESVNRLLTLINQQLLWKKKGTKLYNSKRQISIIVFKLLQKWKSLDPEGADLLRPLGSANAVPFLVAIPVPVPCSVNRPLAVHTTLRPGTGLWTTPISLVSVLVPVPFTVQFPVCISQHNRYSYYRPQTKFAKNSNIARISLI